MNKNFIIFFLFISFYSFSQTGTLRGIIKDKISQEGLPFATVQVKETTIGTTTDFEGSYSFDLEAGEYIIIFSYVGYENLEITNVLISEGEVTNLTASLGYETELLDAVVVTAQEITDTEAALLNVQRKSPNLIDGISSENFKKIGDSDIAGAIKRVPGVSIQEGKYVFVRGLGDRYTKTILNGMDIPGLDPDRNTLQMDIFPTNLIKNVIVLKSSSADMSADFTGGIINIETKDFPEEREFSISVSGKLKPSHHFNKNFLTYNGGKTDWLGYDDGSRSLPIDKKLELPLTVDSDPKLTEYTRSFNPELAARKDQNFMDYSLGITYGNQFKLKNNFLGLISSISYKSSSTFYGNYENYWHRKDNSDNTINKLVIDRYQRGSLGKKESFASGLLGVAFKSKKSKIKLNIMRLQNGESKAGNFFQEYLWENSVEVYKDALEYGERSISNLLLEGKHTTNDASFELNWKFSPTLSKTNDLDLRLTPFRFDENKYTIEPSESGDPTRLWRYLSEYNIGGKIDLSKKYNLFSRKSKFKLGGYYTQKERDFEILNYRIYIRREYDYKWTGDANEVLKEENLWTIDSNQGSYVNGNYEISNTYSAKQTNLAFYILNEFFVGENLRSIVGLRAENYNLWYTGQTQQGDVVYDQHNLIDDLDFFPSINLIYSIAEKSNLRFSGSKTIARPSFKEKSIAQIFDPVSSTTFIGNIDLFSTLTINYDLRWELFQENAQMFAFSAFYKDFKNPIELVAYSGANPNDFTPKNVKDASVYGGEFEMRKNLNFISESLKNLRIVLNLSLIKSVLKMDSAEFKSRETSLRVGEIVDKERVLQGQSPYLINAGLNFTKYDGSIDAGLYFNVQGKTLQIVGQGYVPDVYTYPFNSLNFNSTYKLGSFDQFSLSISVENLLGDKLESFYNSYGDNSSIYSRISPGTAIKFSFGVKF